MARASTATAIVAVIFDMDGVLIDSEPLHFEATRALLAEHGVAYQPAAGEDFFGCTDREVFAALKARYRLEAGVQDLASAWIGLVVRQLARPLVPLHGVPSALDEVAALGLRLALASSSAPPVIAATLAGLGLSARFEATVSGHEVARGKPSPDIFLEAARRLAVDPPACLVVEDSHNGLSAAVAAGMPCAVVPCASTAGQDFSRATVRLATLQDLPGWLLSGRRAG
jgi:beta-phosphoglucomutase-like phosphatase (HAD superfamily)